VHGAFARKQNYGRRKLFLFKINGVRGPHLVAGERFNLQAAANADNGYTEKEIKEAILRIEAGLSTYEDELPLMGKDYQEVFDQ